MAVREWARPRLVECGRAALLGVPFFAAALPLLVLSLLALGLVPVLGLGLLAFPLVVGLTRRLAGRRRRLARPPIPPPYHPVRVLADPATWRDLLWLACCPAGLGLGIVPAALVGYGVEGLLEPLLAPVLPAGWAYGLGWLVDLPAQPLWALPQGALLLWAGLRAAPVVGRLHDRFAAALLGPSRAAQLRTRIGTLSRTRTDALDTQAAELRRIERDLHDGAQARLVALGMSLGLAEQLLAADPDTARDLLAEARTTSTQALAELRDLVRGIHPPVLAERGLDGAVRALALSLPLPVQVVGALPGRPPAPVESAAYFAAAEALANVAKHSGARHASVRIGHAGGRLRIAVTDDGNGGADPDRGTGLRGIQRRLGAFDGTLAVRSPAGGPTEVTLEIPCALSSPKTSPSSATA